ncbi:MAG: hypothetical protein IH949_04005 [Bacteroidetes bacterium]|nr:hypothetical protein [Bacteroidota bacterium]
MGNNNDTQLFDVTLSNIQGESIEKVIKENEFGISLPGQYFKDNVGTHEPLQENVDYKISKVRPILPGDSKKVTHNMTLILSLIETILFNLGFDTSDKINGATDEELYKIDNLLDLITAQVNSSKDEIEKQLNYVDVCDMYLKKQNG